MQSSHPEIYHFWQLVSDNLPQLREFIYDPALVETEFMETLFNQLAMVSPCITICFTPDENQQVLNMVFGCEGEQVNIEFVLELVAQAPKMEGIHALAFSPRAEIMPTNIKVDGFDLAADLVYFRLETVNNSVCLDVYLDDCFIGQEDPRYEAVMLLIETSIGEYQMMTTVAVIDWHDLPVDPEDYGLQPMTELRSQFDKKVPEALLHRGTH